MSAITIRKLPDEAKQRLRMRAAAKGRSMEAEARDILLTSLDRPVRADLNWVQELLEVADTLGGIEVDAPLRRAHRPVDVFGVERVDSGE